MRLVYSGPYDWPATLAFLSRRAVGGVEQVDRGVYRRTIRCGDLTGLLEITHDEVDGALCVGGPTEQDPSYASTVASVSTGSTATVADDVRTRVRRMFDLDADLPAIAAHLARDPWMASLVTARPAMRVFGGWDGFEVAARSVIGQQVTVEHARRLNGTLVARCGSELPSAAGDELSRVFPTPQQVLSADLSSMGMPGARIATLKAVAAAVIADPCLFDRAASLADTTTRLRGIRGVGDWTAHYIAMRACREPDAFPASDVGLLRGGADSTGVRPTPAELLARAEAWRPWRAYAAYQLWARDAGQRL